MALNPDLPEVYYNGALLYQMVGHGQPAIECFERAIKMDPDNLQFMQDYHDLLLECDWQKAGEIANIVEGLITKQQDNFIMSPMRHIKYNIDPAGNLTWAKKFTNNRVKNILNKSGPFKHKKPQTGNIKKILKVAYISSDITNHPVTQLMRGVFKNHNKNEFEIFLYSTAKKQDSAYRNEVIGSFDRVIDTALLDNMKLAKLIYNDNIDILIDLNGHTGQPRLEALALKPAPIQAQYIGYIGSMGADFIDYIITDRIVTPLSHQKFYTEKFIYMPDCYQANDNQLEISSHNYQKKDFNLPEDKFIFCSFNQSFKIEPVMFQIWMNILKKNSR